MIVNTNKVITFEPETLESWSRSLQTRILA